MWTGIPIDDPLNYPLYTAACDLGVPVCINVGVPGPMKPARLQRTILVDEVALCFPDLPIVMSHVGDPWVDETIAMLVKHPNVYLMTAGFAPKYLPEPLVRFMDCTGRDKVMWSSYFPIMTVERTLREGKDLPLRPRRWPGISATTRRASSAHPSRVSDRVRRRLAGWTSMRRSIFPDGLRGSASVKCQTRGTL